MAFRQNIFARPGVTVASTGPNVAKALRVAGASTAYWEMNLQNLAGTPTAPADPATMDAVAASEVQKAQASTACANPLIALNELLGSDIPGPLPAAAQRYRDSVLALMRALAAQGATPFLLVPAPLHGDGDGGLVAPGRTGRLARAGGLHPGDGARGRRESVHHQPRDPRPLPRMGLAPDRPRHPGLPPRPDARLPVGSHRPCRASSRRAPGSGSSSSSPRPASSSRASSRSRRCGRGGGGRSPRRTPSRRSRPRSRPRRAPTCGRATRRCATRRRSPRRRTSAASTPT